MNAIKLTEYIDKIENCQDADSLAAVTHSFLPQIISPSQYLDVKLSIIKQRVPQEFKFIIKLIQEKLDSFQKEYEQNYQLCED